MNSKLATFGEAVRSQDTDKIIIAGLDWFVEEMEQEKAREAATDRNDLIALGLMTIPVGLVFCAAFASLAYMQSSLRRM